MKKYLLLTGAGALLTVSSFAGSFQLNLQGIRQMAMGGSGVAVPWDASVIFYNPGALSCLGNFEVYGNAFVVSPHVKYLQTPTGGYSYETNTHTAIPFAIYAGGNISHDKKWAAGIGVYTPFGNSLHWDNDWTGRYIIQDISLESVFIQPTVSYRVNDVLSIGAGFVYAIGSVDITKAIPIQNQNGDDGNAQLKGDANGIGFNAGVHIKASDKFDIGMSYRSGVKMKVKNGNANFNVVTPLSDSFPKTKFSTELPLPGMLTAGVGYKATKDLTIQLDLVYAFWSNYDSLKFDFKENTSLLEDTHDPRDYKNTLAIRAGAHYKICDQWEAMIGAAYDPTPSRSNLVSPDAVDANRVSLACGLGFKPVEKLSIMAGLNYTLTGTRSTTYYPDAFSGAYQIRSLTPALGISYKF